MVILLFDHVPEGRTKGIKNAKILQQDLANIALVLN